LQGSRALDVRKEESDCADWRRAHVVRVYGSSPGGMSPYAATSRSTTPRCAAKAYGW
jgi:hypothetical protein